MNWIKIKDEAPNIGANVIAVGTWYGEINGEGESEFMCIGEWTGSDVSIDSDTYSTNIINVTHWMPIPDFPTDND